MNKLLYNAMFSNMQKTIEDNKEQLKILQEIDFKHYKIQVEVAKLLEIIEYYKEKDISYINKDLIIYCNGNPYVVLNIILISIIYNCNLELNIQDTMVGVNTLIIKIINNILNVKIALFDHIENNNREIIFIDRINDFNIMDNSNKKYIPYQSIDVYSDNPEYEDIFETVYNYAMNTNMDIDIFDEDEGIENLFKYGKGKIKLILTKNKKIIEKYTKENVYINENPFNDENIIFDDNIIREIIQ